MLFLNANFSFKLKEFDSFYDESELKILSPEDGATFTAVKNHSKDGANKQLYFIFVNRFQVKYIHQLTKNGMCSESEWTLFLIYSCFFLFFYLFYLLECRVATEPLFFLLPFFFSSNHNHFVSSTAGFGQYALRILC